MAAQTLTVQYGSDSQKTVNVSTSQDNGLTYVMGQLNAQRALDNVSRVAAGQAAIPLFSSITDMLKDILNAYCATAKTTLKGARLDVISGALDTATNPQLASIATTLGVTL